ncbi:DUF6264 family protein [Microbacterium sp. 179-I 3D3 NHS]|uniref:DUF6264 family protein n=1 Tax=Microbacterium sp. 179-I 3D3 NHS TaxID=3142382 RepID=UPI0039A3A5CA
MTEQRPRYGELATPEEQRRAAGLEPTGEQAPAPIAVEPVGVPREATDPTVRRTHPVDRVVTIALLAYGLINVIVTALSYLDLTRVMNESMAILGIDGEFTNYAQGKLWGTVAAIVLIVGWSVTAWASIRRLRSGRITWWVPLVGAVATMLVASVCLAVPMMGDPAFVSYLENMRG